VHDRPSKTIFAGIAKARKGSPAISLQTLIDRAKRASLFETIKVASVSDDEALDAAKRLSKPPSARQHVEAGAVTGALAPAIQAVGRGAKALVDAKHGRVGEARKAFMDTTKGGLVQAALGGGLTGAGISLSREGLRTQQARKTYQKYLQQHGKDT
jgi:hypothetical protein